MKTKLNLVLVTLLAVALLNGCKKKEEPTKSDEEIQLEKLSKTWALGTGSDAVTYEGTPVATDWAGFTLTLGNKTYSSANAFSPDIWPASGSWDFGKNTDGSTNVNVMVRDDGTEISIQVTDTSLKLQFTYSATGGRLTGIEGDWVFDMVPQ